MEIKPSHYYSNGAYGRTWGVRMVMAIQPDPDTGKDMVHFKGVAGSSRRQTGSMPVDEFLRWAKYEVRLVENDWKRIGEDLPPPNLPRQAGEEQTSRCPDSLPPPSRPVSGMHARPVPAGQRQAVDTALPASTPRQAGEEQTPTPPANIPSPLAGEG